MLNEIYAAGFFDGEGCVHISKDGRVQVSVTQKKKEVLHMFQEKYGGQIYSKANKFFDCSHWKLTSKDGVIQFLTDILPHSLVKPDEIKLGLKSAYLIRDINVGCNPLSQVELDERVEIRKAMQLLRPNKKYQNTTTAERTYREEVKKRYNYKCQDCGKDLQGGDILDQLIRDGVLICRVCNGKRTTFEHKPLSKEIIEEALSSTTTLDEACAKLGIVRCTLYKKRKKFGMTSRYNVRQKVGSLKPIAPISDGGIGANIERRAL